MKLETFFENFDQFADAPDAVAKMRELVLELAVQGRLVPQDSRDASAAQELAELDLGILELDPRFDIPTTWVWAPLEPLLLMMKNGFNGKPNKLGGHYKVTRIETIARGTIDMSRVGFADELPPEVVEKHLIQNGDILFSHINSEPHLGKTAICTFDDPTLIHGVNLLLLRTKPQIDPQFLNTAFKELRVSGYFVSIAQRAINQSSINQKNLGKTLIPLPPLAEQKRIVAKVDELMALCDRLALQQQERETRHAALARASLARFADAPTPANLHFLFHPSYAISPADLRKSIFTLAVQGKLVPQDPNDEPAGADSESKPLFEIPVNWRWHRLGTLGLCRTGKTPSTSDPTNYGPGFPFIGPGQITLSGRFTAPEKSITPDGLESSTEAKPDDILMVCIGGSIGKAAICREPIGFNQQINSVRLQRDLPEFIYLAVTAGYFQEQVLANASGSATPIINKGKWEQISIPLPPLSEQRRIVAKVSELMALVDALESQLAASRATAENLLAAVVAELTEGTHASPAC